VFNTSKGRIQRLREEVEGLADFPINYGQLFDLMRSLETESHLLITEHLAAVWHVANARKVPIQIADGFIE
jgi:hypothetical protein